MPLVRCPKHRIPFNDENPRGCPACDQERKGRQSESAMMQELARAASGAPEPPIPASAPENRWNVYLRRWIPNLGGASKRNLTALGLVTVVFLIAGLVWLAQPRFVEQMHPVILQQPPRPLSINPRQPVTVLFAVLGTQPPRPHPRDPSVERYSYGTDLTIDAVNGFIYAITMGVPNRSWRGLRVGMTAQEAEGAVALLGPPLAGGRPPPPPELQNGYLVFRGLNARPRRTITAEVRPPNGCFDVAVELQPQAIGLLIKSGRRYAVVAREGGTPKWVVTRIQVIDRGRRGPIDTRAC